MRHISRYLAINNVLFSNIKTGTGHNKLLFHGSHPLSVVLLLLLKTQLPCNVDLALSAVRSMT